MINFSLFEQIDLTNSGNIFVERTEVLRRLSQNIENHIIQNRMDVQLFVGFQRARNFLKVASQYRKISQCASEIWVFAIPDRPTPGLSNTRYVGLQTHQKLAKEWFLVVNHATYSRALIAKETTAPDSPERLFTGVLIYDPDTIWNLSCRIYDQTQPR